MVDKVVHIALQRAIAAGRVGIEPTARFDGDVGRFLHRLRGEIAGRLHDDCPLAADPGDDRRPVFVVVAPAGLALLAATPWPTTQRRTVLLPGCLIPSTDRGTCPFTTS